VSDLLTKADVAELVDARDLKSFGPFDSIEHHCKKRPARPAETLPNPSHLQKDSRTKIADGFAGSRAAIRAPENIIDKLFLGIAAFSTATLIAAVALLVRVSP
jgi:hypothetical protein